MRRNLSIFLLTSGFWLLASSLSAQQPITPTSVETQEIRVLTPALAPVPNVSTSIVGNGGPATYFYWIVARYPQGNATPSTPALISTGPRMLSGSNYIRVSWTAVTGATSYDVLRTTANQLPSGTAAIAVATAVAGTSQNDTGGALAAYTLTTLAPRQISLQLQPPLANFLGSVQPPVSAPNNARMYYDASLQQMMLSRNGGAYAAFGGGAGAGIADINGLSSTSQFFNIGTTCATGFNIQDSIDTHSLNISDADATHCGLLTTGAQVLAGSKTFTGDTLMNGDLYVTGYFSTDHNIEITGEDCVASESNVGLFGFNTATGQPCFSFDGSAPVDLGTGAVSTVTATLPIVSSGGANPDLSCPTCGGGTAQTIGSGRLTGGVPVWTGLLTFNITASTYLIAGNSYASVETPLVLDPADGSDPRIDVFYLDDAGLAGIIKGTAHTPASKPSIDPATQLEIGFAYVDTGATVPSNFTDIDLYLEDAEWTCTASAHFDCASLVDPYAGTKSIEATAAVAGNSATLVKPAAATENLSAHNSISFEVKNTGANWPNAKSLQFYWTNGVTPVGSSVTFKNATFGFDQTNHTAYQQIAIPISAFNTGQNLVTTLRVRVAGGGAAIADVHLDNIRLQATGSILGNTQPYDVATYFPGVPTASQVLQRIQFVRAIVFPPVISSIAGSAGTGATATPVISLQKNGTEFGTCTFAGTACTYASIAGATFVGGDVLTIVNPNPADATLADISITLAGTRQQ